MRKLEVDCRLGYQINDVSECIIQVQAAWHPWQRIVSEQLLVGHIQPQFFTDASGLNRMVRFTAPAGELELIYRAVIEVSMPVPDQQARECEIAELPADVLHYLLPSRYCESDLMGAMARRTFGDLPRGFTRVQAICDWIHQHIAYEIGSSQATTTARDVLANRAGVCRDFAHLGITLCRALNIPARFVFGHVEFPDPPPDFHALFEAYLGGQWMLFDPTKMVDLGKIVRIGTGIDATDVAFATLYGEVQMTYMKPLVRDYVEGQPEQFAEIGCYIGEDKPPN